jgi:hypothetical protein
MQRQVCSLLALLLLQELEKGLGGLLPELATY